MAQRFDDRPLTPEEVAQLPTDRRAMAAYARYFVVNGAGADPLEAMRAALTAIGLDVPAPRPLNREPWPESMQRG